MNSPDISMPNAPDQSTLGSIVGNSSPQIPNPQSPGSPMEQQADTEGDLPSGGGGSRLLDVLKRVAGVASTGLAGLPTGGRPGFVSSLGSGARAEQAAQATAQDIKFKTFSDQVRVATLHNQDLALQNSTQDAQDRHEDHMNAMHANDPDWGIKYDTIANDSTAVMDHMRSQTAAYGSVSVPAGTHVSGDGKTIMIPQDTPETAAGQLSQYKAVGPALGFNLQPPSGATKLDPKVADAFYNKLQGFDGQGNIYGADKLPALIAANQSQRDDLAKKGAPQVQLDALDGIVAKQKAQLKADTDASDLAANKTLARQQALEKTKTEGKIDVNDAKPQKTQSTDWVQGVSADEKKKSELAENMVFNINNVASILRRRPDIVGVIGGRFTSVQQMAGSNDPDIVALGTDIHNIGMANGGIHGMRSPQQAEDYANQVLNHFKNGPAGVYGGLKSSADSVQTFIDAARPETYKTHSKQGGAVRAMVPQAQGQKQ